MFRLNTIRVKRVGVSGLSFQICFLSTDIRVVQDEKNRAQQETLVPWTGAVGRAVHVRGGQRADVYAANRSDVRNRPTVHRARLLDGVRHVARQVRVSN